MKKPFSVIIAGSTSRALRCALGLANDAHFKISAVITPVPKPVGRKQILTKNPLHVWAKDQGLPTILVNAKIDSDIKNQIKNLPQPDFLLVVDFGYLIPGWLLELPKLAPINIHPSALPRWRGSSPGQFAILFGEKTSAITIMIVSQKMDQGPIIKQIPFKIAENWTQKDYYDHSFALASAELPRVMSDFAGGEVLPIEQPEISETPTARRLQKTDSYIPWNVIEKLTQGTQPDPKNLPHILQTALPYHQNLIELLLAASKAFSGWPGLWTEIPTKTGKKRMKILEILVYHDSGKQKLDLKKVHIAGHEKPASWSQVKTTLQQTT